MTCGRGGGGVIFTKNLNFFLKKVFFILSSFLHSIFSCYYCSINLKRQSEHSGLCLDTSSLVDISNLQINFYSGFVCSLWLNVFDLYIDSSLCA